MPTAKINQTEIFYTRTGSPELPVLLFSNSLGTTSDMWQAQVARLGEFFQIIRYDTRGHGRSAAPQGPYSLEMLGRDVLALLDHLEIERVNFCGISMGGLIGQWLAIYAGHRIDRLVIANTASKVGESSAWLSRAALVRAQGLGTIADTAEKRWFTAAFLSNYPECASVLVETLRGANQEGYASCCEALAQADLSAQIKNISCETLIIAGAHDPVTTVDQAQVMQQNINNSQIKILNASHLSSVERPGEFNAAFTDFFLSSLIEH